MVKITTSEMRMEIEWQTELLARTRLYILHSDDIILHTKCKIEMLE